ncbi:MAG: hypothetical protein LBK47_04090 [Prevotellaceae bacterium]|jgi:hypothetical protein|nr:hypothetical protein [Prevotellaceae bacterium]
MKTVQYTNCSIEGIFDNCYRALQHIGCKNITRDYQRGIMQATVGVSIRSFGEAITIQAEQIDTGKIAVHISSESIAAAITTFGKNAQNERQIANFLCS